MRRSPYHILGEVKEEVKTTISETTADGEVVELQKRGTMKEYNTEIYDDDDFYHQLLRELIERKAGESNNPAISKYVFYERHATYSLPQNNTEYASNH